MFSYAITILKYDDFFVNASSNNEPHLHVFHFKQDDVEFVSDEETSLKLKPNYISPCFKLTFEADIRNAKEQILDRR